VLRFLETRFGAEVPHLSAWRRIVVGDLTSTLNLKKASQSIPNLRSTLSWRSAGDLAMCREPGWNDTLPSAKLADCSDSGIGSRASSQRSVLVRMGAARPRPDPGTTLLTLFSTLFNFVQLPDLTQLYLLAQITDR
jgi:hypothetical protein